jgi:hypothetical protein
MPAMALLLIALWLQDPLPIQNEGKGFAAKYPGDRGLRDDKRVVLVENFEDADFRKGWMEVKEPSEKLRLVDDRGGKALEILSDLDKDTGGHLYRMIAPGLDTAYLRFYVWFDPEHSYVHHFVNLMGYNPATRWPQGHAGEKPDGDDRFTTGIEPWGDWGKVTPPGLWNFYSYWCEMKKAPDGKFWGHSFRPKKDVPVERGRWICVEIMLKCNTVGKADGEQAFWIDGKCAGRWGGLRWRTSKDLNVNGVCLSYYMTQRIPRGEDAKSPRKKNRVRFDDVVLAAEYIGPKE